MARTNINLDESLVRKGLKLTGLSTKKDLVHKALQDLVQRENRKKILKLEGKIQWRGNLPKMRKGRFDSR